MATLAVSAFANSVQIGRGSTTATNQLSIGGANQTISDLYLGSGVAVSSPAASSINASGGSGSNIAGATITLAGGKGTGTGLGGSVVISTAPAGSTGSAANALSPRITVLSTGAVGFGTGAPTSIVHIHAIAGSNPTLALSDGDVAHGVTTVAPTDTIGLFTTATTSTASRGGLILNAFANGPGTGDGTLILWATEVTGGGSPAFVHRYSQASGTARLAPSQSANRPHTSWQVHSSAVEIMRLSASGQLGLNVIPAAGGPALDIITSTDSNSTGRTATADTSFRIARFAGQITESNSGTAHPVMATMEVGAPVIANGTSATTVATSLWVSGVPSGITPTAGNYAVFIQGGATRLALDGTVSTPALTLGATADNSTGLWHPLAGAIAMTNAGTETERWTSTLVSYSVPASFTNSISFATNTVVADTTLTSVHSSVRVDATTANITITLPAAAAAGVSGRLYRIKKIDATANTVIVDANAAELIDGSLTKTISAQYGTFTIQSNGTSWDIF